MSDWAETVWTGCYDSNFVGLVVPESLQHPAKLAPGLSKRIYQHLLDKGYIARGAAVFDPFGGICGGALYAMASGLRWIGIELEPRFVELGRQNLEHWRNTYGLIGATLLQGDSRNLARLIQEAQSETGISAVISSPPYGDVGLASDQSKDDRVSRLIAEGRLLEAEKVRTGGHGGQACNLNSGGYGNADGNLANLSYGDLNAVVSSPPYADEIRGGHAERETGKETADKRKTEGGALGISMRSGGYGTSEGNLSVEPNTFWAASKIIVSQCFQILKPGGVSVWVVKRFVRNNQVVPFSQQWAQLCIACGFQPREWIRASFVTETEDEGFFGKEVKRKEKKSFFRRLSEKKGAPRIDFEDVLLMVKP